MDTYTINCTTCKIPLPYQIYNTADLAACPSCGALVRADVFRARIIKQTIWQPGEDIVLDAESGCFFHPQKKAVVPCATCGRFLCSLCDVEFNSQHVCPMCLETGKKKRKIKNLETHRVLYDDIALALALIPMIFVWITVITAPMSLYIAIRHWKSPSAIIPRTKTRFIIAIFISGLQIAGWLFLFAKLIGEIL